MRRFISKLLLKRRTSSKHRVFNKDCKEIIPLFHQNDCDLDYMCKDDDLDYICEEAVRLCLTSIATHLDEFTNDDCINATYEDWIKSLHPENIHEMNVDHRFYVESSDHLKIWNQKMELSGRRRSKVLPQSSY